MNDLSSYQDLGLTGKVNVENFNALAISTTEDKKVFIPNKSGHDFSAAKKYGSFSYVTEGLVNRFSIGHIARKWMQKLVNSKSTDYILITSLTILTVVGAAIFGHLHHRINLLIFRNGKYIARTILFDQLKDAIEKGDSDGLEDIEL